MLWIYTVAIIGKACRPKIRNFMFFFWVLSLVPFIELTKNSLLANLVSVQYTYIDDVYAAINSNRDIYSINKDEYDLMKNYSQTISDKLSEEWITVFDRLKYFDLSGSIYYLATDNQQLIKLAQQTIYVDSELVINTISDILRPYFKNHVAKSSYFPRLASFACFSHNFPYLEIANKMFVQLIYVYKSIVICIIWHKL